MTESLFVCTLILSEYIQTGFRQIVTHIYMYVYIYMGYHICTIYITAFMTKWHKRTRAEIWRHMQMPTNLINSSRPNDAYMSQWTNQSINLVLYTCVFYHMMLEFYIHVCFIIWCLNGNMLVILCMHFITCVILYVYTCICQAWRNKTVGTKPLTIVGWDNGLSPGQRRAIIWTNDGI